MEEFLKAILLEEEKIRKDLRTIVPISMQKQDWIDFNKATHCHICEKALVKESFLDSVPVYDQNGGRYCGQAHKRSCFKDKFIGPKNKPQPLNEIDKWIKESQEDCLYCGKPLLVNNYRDAVKDHCHLTGKYRGAAHNVCNMNLRITPKQDLIPVVFHNLRGYDAHHLFQAMAKVEGKSITCIQTTWKRYISFSLGGARFIDSLNFLQASLDSLLKNIPWEHLKCTSNLAESKKQRNLLRQKGIYPYEYMDGWERFSETKLPHKRMFYSSLNDKHITQKQSKHAKKVWKVFGCKNLGDYHDLYLKTDVCLLADVFENFRSICTKQYGLDPARYYTSPGLSWDALLKKTGVQLEKLTDVDMHLELPAGYRW